MKNPQNPRGSRVKSLPELPDSFVSVLGTEGDPLVVPVGEWQPGQTYEVGDLVMYREWTIPNPFQRLFVWAVREAGFGDFADRLRYRYGVMHEGLWIAVE